MHCILIPLFTLAAFIWLADYSREETGYTHEERLAMNQLIDRETGVLFKPKNEGERAEAIADIWGIK